eukprot:CAMPEP_0116145878 /NCGR_PEP_ID=MMETSP0329-20121206/16858_1 /TAXON_ID=697910 /ORGANISM="Pseudo-nitzschia arenysensis, Strain B593" /LENGTH=283 /DNA_ID=CAMNT_0003641573 /DNA_START=47 /DNA_END=895 /DNA_ORIENTATION=-
MALLLVQILGGGVWFDANVADAFDSGRPLFGRPLFQMPTTTLIKDTIVDQGRHCWGCPFWKRMTKQTTEATTTTTTTTSLKAKQQQQQEDEKEDATDHQTRRKSRPSSRKSKDRDVHKTNNNHKTLRTGPKRRTLVLGSVAAVLSSIATSSSPARASNLAVLEESENRRIEVFERNAPSVVFIDTFAESLRGFYDTFAEKQDVFSPNVMEVPIGTGSGFVWDKDGHIVTNYHVVRNAKFAQVALITPRTKNEKKNLNAGNESATLASSLSSSSETDVFGTTSG